MASRKLLISIKPRFAALIFNGTKTVELRRQQPRVTTGDTVVVYESSPVMHVTGTAIVKAVESDTPRAIWLRFRKAVGISKREYDAYFDGADQAVAIHLESPSPLSEPVSLEKLRRDFEINPPQSFRYLSEFSIA